MFPLDSVSKAVPLNECDHSETVSVTPVRTTRGSVPKQSSNGIEPSSMAGAQRYFGQKEMRILMVPYEKENWRENGSNGVGGIIQKLITQVTRTVRISGQCNIQSFI